MSTWHTRGDRPHHKDHEPGTTDSMASCPLDTPGVSGHIIRLTDPRSTWVYWSRMIGSPIPRRCHWRHQKKSHLCGNEGTMLFTSVTLESELERLQLHIRDHVFNFNTWPEERQSDPRKRSILGISLIIICRASPFPRHFSVSYWSNNVSWCFRKEMWWLWCLKNDCACGSFMIITQHQQ